MEDSLFERVFEAVLGCLKYSTNGYPAVTDKDGRARLELALEITESVMEPVEKDKHPLQIMPDPVATPAYRYFKAMDGRVWSCSTQVNNVIRFGLDDSGKVVGVDETNIYGSIENLAECDDVKEIDNDKFNKLVNLLQNPF